LELRELLALARVAQLVVMVAMVVIQHLEVVPHLLLFLELKVGKVV
jgi:hypothetical protein